MPISFNSRLVVAISSRALFNLDKSHEVFENEGIDAFRAYQRANEHKALEPGGAFNLVKKFLKLNENAPKNEPLVEVLLISKNSADTGLRVFNSIKHYNLNISRAAFTSGKSPYLYAKAFGAHLYLSQNGNDVRQALLAGCAAAVIWSKCINKNSTDSLNIAFDGDAVLFSDDSERIFKEKGLEEFHAREEQAAKEILLPGPFKNFLEALHRLQSIKNLRLPIRTALVTARSAPAHERVIHTFRKWNIRVDESLFLGGLSKAKFLEAFGADIFFDDQKFHCESASNIVTSAHVPIGVANETKQ